ncbi:MAG: hypothetical protein HC888_03720 [Candidatus Competibacteraceae bacterium]|nr:hypothetical protein [Candidatus Competibacteraceae bacterium]
MAAVEGQVTRFPGGVGQFVFFGIGATAGAVTVAGIKATDKILLVESIAFSAGAPSAVADLTAEFTVTGENTVDNTGGTSTANMIVAVTVARKGK